MASTSRADSTELAEYLALLRRRWWIVAAGVGLGIVLAAGALLIMPKTYQAWASVQVAPTGLDEGQGPTKEINLETEAQRVRSTAVAGLAQKLMGSNKSPVTLAQNVVVTVPPESSVLNISWTASTPAAAQRGAQAFTEAYLKDRKEKATDRFEAEAKTLEKQISDLSLKLTALPSRSSPQRTVIVSQINAFSNKLSSAKIAATNVHPGEVITQPALPSSPVSPNPVRYLPGGFAAGLLLGLILAFLLDRTDRRIRSVRDVERVLDVPVLFSPPAKFKAQDLGLAPARSRIGQNFHELAHGLTATLGHGNHVILVTGASPGQGSSVVAANIAAALARIENSVMLVCAVLNSTMSTELLGVRDTLGLADVLVGETKLGRAVQRAPAAPSLLVIPPGVDSDLAAEMLQREPMSKVIGYLRSKANFVVIDAPSTAVSADAQALADLADAALVVIETQETRYDQVRDALRQIDRMGAAVLGAVVLPRQASRPKSSAPASARNSDSLMQSGFGDEGPPVDRPSEGKGGSGGKPGSGGRSESDGKYTSDGKYGLDRADKVDGDSDTTEVATDEVSRK